MMGVPECLNCYNVYRAESGGWIREWVAKGLHNWSQQKEARKVPTMRKPILMGSTKIPAPLPKGLDINDIFDDDGDEVLPEVDPNSYEVADVVERMMGHKGSTPEKAIEELRQHLTQELTRSIANAFMQGVAYANEQEEESDE